MFVVDSVRKLDTQIKETVKRLKSLKIDPEAQKVMDKVKDGSFSDS